MVETNIQNAGTFLTADQVAELFQCSKATIWRWRREGLIPNPIKIGRIVLWSQADLATFSDALKAGPAPP